MNKRAVRVGLLDTPVTLEVVEKQRFFTDRTKTPQSQHGNACAKIILRCCPHVRLFVAAVLSHEKRGSLASALEGFNWLLCEEADLVLASIGTSASMGSAGDASSGRGVIPVVIPEALNNGEHNTLADRLGTVIVSEDPKLDQDTFRVDHRESESQPFLRAHVSPRQGFWHNGDMIYVESPSYAAAAMAGQLAKLLGPHIDLRPSTSQLFEILKRNAAKPQTVDGAKDTG